MSISMSLLTGADITIRLNDDGSWTARASVGYSSKEATADDPVRAIGLAALLQAGLTELGLNKKLSDN